jgi:hypothetical protein
MKDRKVKKVLSGNWYQWRQRRDIKKGEGRQIRWKYHVFKEKNKTRSIETVLRSRGEKIKEKDGGGESKIYCKHF